MHKWINMLTVVCLAAGILLVPVTSTMGQVGREALRSCQDFAFSIEEEFVTQGPLPPDGNPIISDGDLLGPNCAVCTRNADLMQTFDVRDDVGLDAVHLVDVPSYLVAFSTELDSPNSGQFFAGDLLVTNGTIIPNLALLDKFDVPRADLGLDAVQLIGDPGRIIEFLGWASRVVREEWLRNPGLLAEQLERYDIDILFSTEGTGPSLVRPRFLDGDLLSARFGVIVESNGTLLPDTVPAGIPARGVDFGLDASGLISLDKISPVNFSTEILFEGRPSFTDGDLLEQGDGVLIKNRELIGCFEPRVGFLGLDAVFRVLGLRETNTLMSQLKSFAARSLLSAPEASPFATAPPVVTASGESVELNLQGCKEIAFSTEEEFITRGPEPPDGNPIISDGDLLGENCVVCARNLDLVQRFDVGIDLGLDAVDVIDVEAGLVAFSTELDSPNLGQFTGGDLLATNGTIIPNLALTARFDIGYDIGLDSLLFVGSTRNVVAFFEEASNLSRAEWLKDPTRLPDMLRRYGIRLWFSTEGTGPSPEKPRFLDGDLLSAADGTVVAPNDILLPGSVPAGIPSRGVDFGLDAVSGDRGGSRELLTFSTEILFEGEPRFTDGDVLRLGNGVVIPNSQLIQCFEPTAKFLGLDGLSTSCLPELEWTWNRTTVEPDYVQVMMAPVVADLNGDSIPDVIFSTFGATGGWLAGGILRAISGDGGSELFSVTDPGFRVQAGAEPAVADIDNDGKPEIIVSKQTGELICLEHDGSHKWTSVAALGRIGVAVADLDEDGTPEIIAGRTAFNNDGTVRWTGTGGSSYISVVANLDLAGHPEVVAGGTAYRYDGTVYWSVPLGGRTAIANFDADPYPEIVLVGGDQVSLREHDGTLKWGPVAMPTGGGNGAPMVADIDGDGRPEIGVAGYDFFVAFETDGSVKWLADTRDYSSRATSSTAFDFDGDGRYEIAYSDERMLYIFKGTDGTVLFETPAPSGTLLEHPVIVDVDNDDHVEIVMPVNNYAFPGNTGIEVYGNDSCWPDARNIWNQHSYHITNINDDATVPTVEIDSWESYNNYRAQALVFTCRADFDNDGDVDGSDLAVFAADFGRTDCVLPPPCEGDFNKDGDVDGSDLALFAADFGRTDCP
jgi:hypothetical protein